jgi:1-acyl-sn-glycerol-3-phosphate acyltransferase
MKTAWKIILIFLKTFLYYLESLIHPERILELKQKWARMALTDLGYEFSEEGVRPQSQEGLILVGNHIGFMDIMVLMAVSPQITFLAKKEVKSWPLIGLIAKRVGTIFVDRSPSADRTHSRKEVADQIFQKRAFVTVFPSGTTSLIENKPWKKGIFEISQSHNVPVKAFKLRYEPLRESAYIDDDSLLGQMWRLFNIPHKKVSLTWLETFQVQDPQKAAEDIRTYVELA